jgi:hypothetical protein
VSVAVWRLLYVSSARGRKTAINALIVSRATFGVAVWLFPRPVGKVFGFDMPGNPQIPT